MKILYVTGLWRGLRTILFEGQTEEMGMPAFMKPLKKLLLDGHDVDIFLIHKLDEYPPYDCKVDWISGDNIVDTYKWDVSLKGRFSNDWHIYQKTKQLLQQKDYDIVYGHGDTGRPEDVILRNTYTGGMKNAIVLRLNHPDALAANLVLENGYRYMPQSNPYGANVAIESAGGTVSNCVIRNGTSTHFYPRGTGAWLNSPAALLTHCVVTNNTYSGVGKQAQNVYAGIVVHVEKGTVANCLVANNPNPNSTGPVTDVREAATCGVTVMDGRILNCTVVTNEARYTGGVYLGSKGYATNVVVAGCVNHCTYVEENQHNFTDTGFKGTLAHASHCASDDWESDEGAELDATCVRGTAASFFRARAARDYRPKMDSPLVDKGVAYAGIAAIDLLGNARLQGRPDIGCYENHGRCTIILVR